MREKYLPAIALLGVIVGASGLGLGAFTMMQVRTGAVKGEDGDDGDDGGDGIAGEKGVDAPGGIMVGILDPDDGETVSGTVTIRAMVVGSDDYTIKVLINGTLNSTYIPFVWNTSKVVDGWWNITVIATDIGINCQNYDTVMIYVDNSPKFWISKKLGVVAEHYGGLDWNYYILNQIQINFDVLEAESVHMEFCCECYLLAMDVGDPTTIHAGLRIWFYLDGVQIENPWTYAYIRAWDGPRNDIQMSLFLQEVFQDLDAGPHTVAMRYGMLGKKVVIYNTILFAEILP